MTSPISIYALEQPIEYNPREYYRHLDEFVVEVIRRVGDEMPRQPAPMVYEMLTLQVSQRLPGIEVDDTALRDAAARIAVGLSPV